MIDYREKSSRDDLILGGLSLLLAIDLLALPWFDISVGVGPISVSVTTAGTGALDGWFGIGFWLAVVFTVGLLVMAARVRQAPQGRPAVGSQEA